MAKVNSKIEERPLNEIASEINGRLILGRGLERFTYAHQLITPKLIKLWKQKFTTKWSTRLSVITLLVCSPNLKDADTDSTYGYVRTI
jgi:hypothetical protein